MWKKIYFIDYDKVKKYIWVYTYKQFKHLWISLLRTKGEMFIKISSPECGHQLLWKDSIQ